MPSTNLTSDEELAFKQVLVENRPGINELVTMLSWSKSKSKVFDSLVKKGLIEPKQISRGRKWRLVPTKKGLEYAREQGWPVGKIQESTHASSVAAGMMALIDQRPGGGEFQPDPQYIKEAVMHLKSGYPEIYQIALDMKNSDDKLKHEKRRLFNNKVEILAKKLKDKIENLMGQCSVCGPKFSEEEKRKIEEVLRVVYYYPGRAFYATDTH